MFDEQEQSLAIPTCPFGPPCPVFPPLDSFPAEAGRVHVGSPALPTPFNFGWLFINLSPPVNAVVPFLQSWVGTVMKAQGKFSVGFNATPLDSACNPQFFVP